MLGYQSLYNKLNEGLIPDPNMPVYEWADKHMVIPKSTGSQEYGAYRTQRTPHAREIMNCLSDDHPCKVVVAMVASQMFKTQIGMNWFGATVHQSPSNFLWLMPTGALAKRLSARVDKVIKAVDVLRERVAKPNSRDAKNTQEVKEYIGGTLFMPTAGSAANLAEVPARRVAIDELDRCDANVDQEGDPVKLAEARQTTFEHNRKSYYYSSPTIDGESRIQSLFKQGTQRYAMAECIHCGHAQGLEFENLIVSQGDALYPCVECGGLHKESDKAVMFKGGLWSDPVVNSTMESFTASAMFLPYGWLSWTGLHKQYTDAKVLLDLGDDSEMIVFYNTRLARCWDRATETTQASVLRERAEDYRLGTVPLPVTMLTAAIDTQGDRLEIKVVGWAEGMECWIIDYRVINSDPSDEATWKQAYDLLTVPYQHAGGATIPVSQIFVDSGGLHTQEVYNFTMRAKTKGFFPIKGDARPERPIIPTRPSQTDYKYNGKLIKKGVTLWHIGTDTAKDYLYARWKRGEGQGAVHFSNDLPEDYYDQLVSEYRASKWVNGKKKSFWDKKKQDRNEALDLMVYNLAAAYKLGLHRLTAAQWKKRHARLLTGEPQVIEVKEELKEPLPQTQEVKKKIRFKPRGFNVTSWT